MEIRTCEEYVLRELEQCQNALCEADKRIEQLELELEAKDRLLNEFKEYFWATMKGDLDD